MAICTDRRSRGSIIVWSLASSHRVCLQPIPARDRLANMLSPEETSAFAQSVLNVEATGRRYLESHPDRSATIHFVKNLQRGVDRVVQGATVACRVGCNHCCHARVEVLAPEAFLIAAELAAQGDDRRKEILAKLERHRASFDETERTWSARRACPFLVEGLCSIYAMRPTACRKAHSLDVASCAAAASSIPQNLQMALHNEALAIGTANAYRDRRLDAEKHEFIAALIVALSVPAAEARWFGGEQLFD
jgi:Fe-S-cluster containining protein